MYSMDELLKKSQASLYDTKKFKETIQEVVNFEPTQEFINSHADEINQEMIRESISKLNEFKREYLAYQAGEGMANPGFKPELFINGNYINVRYVPTEDYYNAKAIRKQQALISNSTMSREVRNAKLSEFNIDRSDNRVYLLNEVMNFIDQYENNPYETQGLYIHGPFGVGKTYLLGAMANDLITRNISVNMLHFPTFINELKKYMQTPQQYKLMEDAKGMDILIIDDIGAEANSSWVRDDVLNTILEYRMKESLPTFFTSNFNFDELEHHFSFSKNGEEQVKAKRMMERVRYLAKEVKFDGENLRRGHKE